MKTIDCPDCNKDWGHSYCGTCKGNGYLPAPVTPQTIRHDITEFIDKAIKNLGEQEWVEVLSGVKEDVETAIESGWSRRLD